MLPNRDAQWVIGVLVAIAIGLSMQIDNIRADLRELHNWSRSHLSNGHPSNAGVVFDPAIALARSSTPDLVEFQAAESLDSLNKRDLYS